MMPAHSQALLSMGIRGAHIGSSLSVIGHCLPGCLYVLPSPTKNVVYGHLMSVWPCRLAWHTCRSSSRAWELRCTWTRPL